MNTSAESTATANAGPTDLAQAPHARPATAHASATHGKKARAKRFLKPLLFLALAGAVIGGSLVAVRAFHYEKTDDAYVTGHLHQISPQIDGRVSEVLVRDNQEVKAGDVLVRIESRESEIAVQKARAQLEEAQAQEAQTHATAKQLEAQFSEAKAHLAVVDAQRSQSAAQLDLARLTLERATTLQTKNGAITQAELDTATSSYKAAEAAQAAADANRTAAEAAIDSVEASLHSAQAQIAAAHANVDIARSAVQDAERKLGYTTLVAPVAGRVGNRTVEAGNYVVSGQIILSLAADDMWVVANFKETQLTHMHTGQPVDLSVDALGDESLHGVVESIAPASGAQFALLPPDNATGNFNKVVQRVPVKITLDAASAVRAASRLRLGFSVVAGVRVR